MGTGRAKSPARVQGNAPDHGVSGSTGATPSGDGTAITFLHGPVPVERESSRFGEWVHRGDDTPLCQWVQGVRSLPRVVQGQDP